MISLLFNTLSRFIKAFLPRRMCLLISWLQSVFTAFLETKEIKSVTVSISSLSICHEMIAMDAMILVFWVLSFKPFFTLTLFHFYSFTIFMRIFSSSSHSASRVVSSAYLRLFIILLAISIQRLERSQWSKSRCFSGIPLLSVWSGVCCQFDGVPLPFLNPACTSGSSQFIYAKA